MLLLNIPGRNSAPELTQVINSPSISCLYLYTIVDFYWSQSLKMGLTECFLCYHELGLLLGFLWVMRIRRLLAERLVTRNLDWHCADGGKNPSFNETFKIQLIEGLREINASVWNSNTIERDDYIGSTK